MPGRYYTAVDKAHEDGDYTGITYLKDGNITKTEAYKAQSYQYLLLSCLN